MNAPTAAVSEAFCELVRTYNACMQKTLSKYGLYPGQPQVLFAISKLGAPTQIELASQLGVTKASAGVSLRRLEAAGFVKRVRDKLDTRCVRIRLTQKGADYARWCDIDFEMIYTTMMETFSAEERDEQKPYRIEGKAGRIGISGQFCPFFAIFTYHI